MDWKLDIGYRMVREEMVFRSGQILPTVMETMDEQGDTGSQERMEIELPDEGVESQEGNQSFHPSDLTFEQVLEEMAEIHEELKAKSVPRVQLRTLEESLVEQGLIKRCRVLVKNIGPELEAKDGKELPLPRPKGGVNRLKEEPGSEVVHTDSE